MLYATHAVVRLDNIKQNLDNIRAHIGADRKILIAVKANAYGHGAVAVSRMVERTKSADWLGVATVPEGIELRDAGIKLPILKLSHCIAFDEVTAAIRADMALTVVSLESAKLVQQACEQLKISACVHMKLDTGMRRIGAAPEEVVALARFIEDSSFLTLGGAFTHLPVSDAPAHDDFTTVQLQRFIVEVSAIETEIGRQLELVHCANSGGVLGQPAALLTTRQESSVMVRPGIMIYGYYPDATTPHSIDLHPGIELKTAVTFVKPIKAGETVGYGRTWEAPCDTFIATIPAGYADGFSRLNSNCGRVLINGKSYPIVGRVCMDQSMVDLGADSEVKVGDAVTLIGSDGAAEITCDELAERMGTITYEVTCLLTPRVARHYVDPI
ncbi:MAG: alanine racemase [Propionibacteriaceae bacterium]